MHKDLRIGVIMSSDINLTKEQLEKYVDILCTKLECREDEIIRLKIQIENLKNRSIK